MQIRSFSNAQRSRSTHARLAGISVATLRMWWRRYALVGPRLGAGKQRLYSAADVRRLVLIKQLVDMGHPIGTIASPSTTDLDDMRAAATSRAVARVAVVNAPLVEESLRNGSVDDVLTVNGSVSDMANATHGLAQVEADIVIVAKCWRSAPQKWMR